MKWNVTHTGSSLAARHLISASYWNKWCRGPSELLLKHACYLNIGAACCCCPDVLWLQFPFLPSLILSPSHKNTHTQMKGEVHPVTTVLQCWVAVTARGMSGISLTPQNRLRQDNRNLFPFPSPHSCRPPLIPQCPMTNIILQCMIKSMEWSICYNKKRIGDISLAYTIPTSPLLPLPLTVPQREESAHFRWPGSPLIPACWDAE